MLWTKSSDVECESLYRSYIVISEEYHCEKAEMGLNDPKPLSGCMCPLMGRFVPYVYCSSKVNMFYCSVVV